MTNNEKIYINGKEIQNRVVFQPMEGCDCNLDGSPSDLTVQKYVKNVKSGAGTVWFEANAVCSEGRTNPRQMWITEENLPIYKDFIANLRKIAREENGFEPIFLIQLTHSGRQSMTPMIAYRNSVYEATRPVSDGNIVSDEYLDTLPEKFARSARLAMEAGFDGVDVKSCHGYLFQELLSAYNRQGRYGGSFENRTKLLTNCFMAVKNAVEDDFIVASRLGLCDMVPYPNGFGTDKDGNIDLKEPFKLVEKLHGLGLNLINVTVGNPYYNPHVNRPFRTGPYKPSEQPSVGLARYEFVEKELKKAFPDILVVGSGLSYYRENLIEKSEELLNGGVCDFVGYGRETLAYPEFYKDWLQGKFNSKKTCVTCSKCTALMRGKCVSGCAVYNEYYRNLFKENIK